jgi:CRP-like cAMP-binding protein
VSIEIPGDLAFKNNPSSAKLSPIPMTQMDQEREAQTRLLARFGRSFSPGELLFADGDPATEAYLLQEGRVRLIKRVGAAERNLRILRPGDMFGETALLSFATRSSTAVAASEGMLLVLDQRTLEQIVSTHPAVALRVMQQLVRRLRDAEDQIEVLMLDDSRSKVVVALLKLAQQVQPATLGGHGGIIELNLSPMELATRVGLDLDTVKRAVVQLRETGHLQIVGEHIEIPNLASLKELSNLLCLRDQITGISSESRNSHPTRDS